MTTPHKALLIQARDALRLSATPLAKDRQEVLQAIAALRAAIDAPEPVNWKYVTRLLVAAGHVTQSKVDEACQIAGLTPAVSDPLSDAEIDAVTVAQWGKHNGAYMAAYRAYARAIESKIGAKP